MVNSQWHRYYASNVSAPPGLLFSLLADMPGYGRWLPPSGQYASTTDVQPYPVQLGSQYRDGRPGEPGREWAGSVTGFQSPGSIDFRHVIRVRQLRATVDVRIHYSIEPDGPGTLVTRWLVLDIRMPLILRPLRPLITASFDTENLRTMAAVTRYAEAHATDTNPTPAD